MENDDIYDIEQAIYHRLIKAAIYHLLVRLLSSECHFYQNNIITDHKTKATELHQRLDIWLSEVEAKFPVLDSEYVPEKEQARLHKLEQEFMPKLEVEHAEYLNPNWQPNEDWWGSQVTID